MTINKGMFCGLLIATSALASCIDGGGGGSYCARSFIGGSTNWGCTNCSGIDPLDGSQPFNQAIDNNSNTATAFGLGAAGRITVSAVAPTGIIFPAGTNAGVLMRFPLGTFTNASVQLTAYNGSTPVPNTSGGQASGTGSAPSAGNDLFVPVQPAAAFNRLDAVISVSGNADTANFRLNEFCGDK